MMRPDFRFRTADCAARTRGALSVACALALTLGLAATPAAALVFEPRQSPRLERAKDLIADEQWERAIEQLKAAVADTKERNKDEALFWLAHSLHQARDLATAVETVAQLETGFPSSRWVKPARSLRIEIAQKLRRNDVLWLTAQPVPLPAAPAPPVVQGTPSPSGPRTPPAARGAAPAKTPAPPPPVTVTVTRPPTSAIAMAAPSTIWIPDGWDPDTNLRIQALGSLMQTDAQRVIPILKEIALESPNPNEASRALFVLAQSGRPEAHATVLDIARRGSESAQIAAVRELGRFGGPIVSEQLLQVYSAVNPRVKYQVVSSLGERAATVELMKIAEKESDRRLQETAIIRLGQAGALTQLQSFYGRARPDLKRPIIIGLFNARAEEELIRIADQERDPAVRAEVLTRLRLLGTPKARAYIEKQAQNR